MLGDATLLGVSLSIQLVAAGLALRVGWRTRQRGAWLLVALSLALMGVRRGVTLVHVLSKDGVAVDPVAEWIALAISLTMLAGITLISPVFLSLRETRERASVLGRILEDSLNEIYVFDAATLRFLEANRGARTNLGYTMEELRALTPLDLNPEFDRDSFEVLLAPLRSRERPHVRFATWHRRRDGTRYPVEVALQPAHVEGRRVFVAILLDVTERERAEAERRRLALAMEQAGEGITVLDAEARIVYANPAFAGMMGWARERLIGASIGELVAGDGDVRLLRGMRDTLHRGETWRGRYETVWRDGTHHVRDASVAPVRGRDGRIVHTVGVIRDVSREAELEHDLRQAQKMEAVGQLAGGVAHDFNNILTVISGYSELLLDQLPAGSRGREAAREISRATERASALTRQLLTFSRKERVKPQPVDLNGLLAGLEQLLHRVIGGGVTLDLELEPDIGWVEADPGQLEQVVVNLAINARDAMPEGGRLVLATREVDCEVPGGDAELVPGAYVVLTVSDTGHGMDAPTLERIFEPFFTTKDQGRGTGLGLSTTYGIVRGAGGVIRVASEPDRGATFEILLPRREPGEAAAASRPEAPALAHKDRCVLLVEDEPRLLELIRSILTGRGHRVLAAVDGVAALELLEREACAIDLLVTDVQMPRMSGPELAVRLRDRFPQLKVVMTSGYAEIRGAMAPGPGDCDAFVRKPFRPEQLLEAVAAVLGEEA